MARHAAPELEREELDYDRILPEDTPLAVKVLAYLFVIGFAALGFWCVFVELFT